jgi:cytochrome c biogenesis protein CcmG, thiol:disulfide interchange protein DsbE
LHDSSARERSDPLDTPSRARTFIIGAFLVLIAVLLGAMALVMARREGASFAGFGVNSVGRSVDVQPRPAPDFTLKSLNGADVRLSDLRGQVVVLNFWASWCPPCRDEARALESAWRAQQGREVVFLGLDLWDADNDARTFVTQFGVSYPTIFDLNGTTAIEYGVTGIPETFGVDANGVLKRRWVGPMNAVEAAAFVESLR